MKKTLVVLVLMVAAIFLFACKNKTPKLTLDADKVDMYVGDTYEIKAVVENTENEIIYKIKEGTNLVTLNGKVITAIEEGTAVIEVTIKDVADLKAELTINIAKKAGPLHEHVVCPECGKCTSEECDGETSDKCLGHEPKHEHVVCPECGKCTSEECDGEASDKCLGHEPKHEHIACPECGKCTSEECDGETSDKCLGHEPKQEIGRAHV